MSMMQNQRNQIRLKIVFVGQTMVGKTSLLRRQAQNDFNSNWICTIGVDFKIKTYKVGNLSAKVQLWDTAGQQRFRSIQKPYYKGAQAALLCFDLSDRKTFDNLEAQLNQIKDNITNTKIYLIGCKSDLDPQVFTDEILIFAERNKYTYFQTSSKQSEGVKQCFQSIVAECVQTELQRLAFGKTNNSNQILVQKKAIQPKSRCC